MVTAQETKCAFVVDCKPNLLQLHQWYAARYFLCEALCLGNVLLQMLLMDRFLDGEFLSYGTRVQTMGLVFPKVTKCLFHRYGPSGGMETLDTLCVLPLNVVNEKTYVLLWFWFLALGALLSALLVYRLLLACSPTLRLGVLRVWHRGLPPHCARTLATRLGLADWWLLLLLADNVDERVFRNVALELAAGDCCGRRRPPASE